MQYRKKRKQKDFVELIKQYSTDECLVFFSRMAYVHFVDIMLNQENKIIKVLSVQVEHWGRTQTKNVGYTAWDILDMAYLALMNTRNYRKEISTYDEQVQIIDAYRKYENDHSAAEVLEKNPDDIFCVLAGMTHEQFSYGNMNWILNRFNRNYHILYGSNKISRGNLKKTEQIIQNCFGISVDEFIMTLYILIVLCFSDPIPMKAYEKVSFVNAEDKELYRRRIETILEYYSESKNSIEASEAKLKLGKQIFYSKPFAYVNKKYISVSCYLALMLYADGIYWLIRDYCNGNPLNGISVNFPLEFGGLFENYFKEIAEYYLEDGSWKMIPKSEKKNEKSADAFIETEKAVFFIEMKSAIIPLQGKQQVPDAEKIKKYCKDNLLRAYNQLAESEKLYTGSKPIIKIILSYENLINANFYMKATSEFLQDDSRCNLMGIEEFESLLQIYQADKAMFDEIVEYLLDQEDDVVQSKNIFNFIEEKSIKVKSYFSEERNYWSLYSEKCKALLK